MDKYTIRFFDVGMYQGLITDMFIRSMANHGYANWKVYGFEPCRATYQGLIHKYSFEPRVKIYRIAISDKSYHWVPLYHHPSHAHGHSIYQHNIAIDPADFESAYTMKFTDWLKANEWDCNLKKGYNILKTNCEGAEYYLYHDIIETEIYKNFKLFCGTISDVGKVHGSEKDHEFRYYLKEKNIEIVRFCDEGDYKNMSHLLKYVTEEYIRNDKDTSILANDTQGTMVTRVS